MFQTEMYELFHRRAPARLVHLICTPLINVALLAVLAALIPGGAFVGAAAIVLWSLYVDRIAGVIVVPLVLVAAFGAGELAATLGNHAIPGALIAAWAGGFLQAISHASEPIPPPWTGGHRFMPLGEWLRTAPGARIAILGLLSPTVFPMLEVWAAPRVWVLQALPHHDAQRLSARPAREARGPGRRDDGRCTHRLAAARAVPRGVTAGASLSRIGAEQTCVRGGSELPLCIARQPVATVDGGGHCEPVGRRQLAEARIDIAFRVRVEGARTDVVTRRGGVDALAQRDLQTDQGASSQRLPAGDIHGRVLR